MNRRQSASAGCGAARRTSSPACSASCSSRSSSRSSSGTSSTSRSAGRPSCPSSPGCTWCCWARPSGSRRARRSASTSSRARWGRRGRRIVGLVVAVAVGRPVRHGAAGHDQVRHLHEGREHVVPQDPPRLPVFGLHRLRGGGDRPLSLGDREPACAARRRKKPTSPRRAPDYEPDQPLLPGAHRHRRLEPARAAGRATR